MVWLPASSEVTGSKVAVPPESVTGEPTLLPSMTSWAVPVGTPWLGETGAIVAEKLTASPETVVVSELDSVASESALETVTPVGEDEVCGFAG